MARKRKTQLKPESRGMAKLKRDLLKDGVVMDVAEPLPGEPKLSAALIKLVSPFAPYTKTVKQYSLLIGIAVTAWNLPLLKGPEHEAFYTKVIQPLLESGDKDMRLESNAMFSTLLQRRIHYFPDDKRLIVSYTVTDNGDEYNVVVATVKPNPIKNPSPNTD